MHTDWSGAVGFTNEESSEELVNRVHNCSAPPDTDWVSPLPTPRLGLRRRIVLLVTLMGLIATACGGGASSTTTEAATPAADTTAVAAGEAAGNPLYQGQFAAFADREVDFEALEGQDVVLWFWAPW